MERWLVRSGALLLFIYVCFRSYTLSLTYDEITSTAFTRTMDWSGLSSDANIHLLNVVLVSGILALGGTSEFALRLPNTIAFVFYLWAAVDLGRHLKRDRALVQFALLAMCPFVLDFFSLSRGYGLGLGMMLSSMTCAVRSISSARFSWAALSILFGMAGVLASYPMLNIFLPMTLLLLVKVASGTPGRKTGWIRSLAMLIPTSLFLFLVLRILFGLRAGGQLYFGGREGFWPDTIISLGRCIGYHSGYSHVVVVVFTLLFGGALLVAARTVYIAMRTKDLSSETYLAAVLLIAVLLPIVQHRMFGTNFPVERTAIFYYPLVVLVLLRALNGVRSSSGSLVGALLGAGCMVHFLFTMNLDHAYSWRYDSGSREAVDQVLRMRTGPTILGIDFFNSPSIHYYRDARRASELKITEVMGAWEHRPGIEELDPLYYGHDGVVPAFDSLNMIALLNNNADVYYLDQYYIGEMDRLGVHYDLMKTFPGSNTSLVTNVRY